MLADLDLWRDVEEDPEEDSPCSIVISKRTYEERREDVHVWAALREWETDKKICTSRASRWLSPSSFPLLDVVVVPVCQVTVIPLAVHGLLHPPLPIPPRP